MTQISQLAPQELWTNFEALNAVPRASKKEERVRAFIVDFAKSNNLDFIVDHIGNVIIKKPATSGHENRKTIVIQSHLDMVHQKNNDTQFDFDTEGIKMYIDGDWVKADGTTLGADNGIGVASIMAILASDTIEHPAIEALLTIDEVTGMTGAIELKGDILKGKILLNLDTEDDSEIDIGCAGGIDVSITGKYQQEDVSGQFYKLTVSGLSGGHSGMDIDKGLANANVLMNRILYRTSPCGMHIDQIIGGSLRNAIPRESFAKIIVEQYKISAFLEKLEKVKTEILDEFGSLESQMTIKLEKQEATSQVMSEGDQKRLLGSIYGALNGVYRMSPDIEDLVECSNNVAMVKVENGSIQIDCLTRSSVESSKMDLADKLRANFELASYDVNYGGSYPGWKPNRDSAILKVLTKMYEDIFGEKADVVACHAGLECGIIGSHYPEMDMISFGPTIRGAHSPDERVSISSVQKYWKFLMAILKNIPEA